MQHREWLQMALEAAQVGTWSWNPATNEMIWSDQAGSIFGVPKDAFGGTYEAFLDLVHPEDRDAVAQRIETTLHGSSDRYKVEHRTVRPDGAIRWVENRGQMTRPTDDQPIHLAGTVIDITERKERERTSRESEAYRQQLYQMTSDPDLTGEEKVHRLLALGCERLGVENGFVSHIDEATGRYEIQMAYGSDNIQAGTERDLSTMYCERTITSDDILGIYNAAEEGWTNHPSYELLHIGCYMGGKILVDDELYGTLCFVNREPRAKPFTHDEKAFVDLMTRWVSHVFERRKHTQHLRIKHRAMEAAPIGITITDPQQEDNPLVYVNEAFQRLTGYSAEETLGRNCRFLQGEGTDSEPVAELRAAIDANESVTVELRNHRKDGTTFWNRVSIAPVANDAGEVTHFVGFQENVTGRKDAERQLRDANETLEAVIEASPNAIVALDLEGTVKLWNPAAERIFGWNEDEVLGKQHPIVPEAQRGKFEEYRRHLAAGETLTGVEVERKKKDGSPIELSLSAAPLHDANDNVMGIMGILEDIRERKEAERQSRQRERQLARYKQYTDDILNAIDDLLFVADETGALLRWNETLPAVTGYSDEEIASMHALEIFAEDDRDAVQSAIDRVMQTGSGRVEAHLITEEGMSLSYEFAAGALKDPDGNRVLAGIGRDISEREERERRLKQLTEEYETVFNNTQDAIFLLDVEDAKTFRISRLNPAEEELLGLSTADVKGKTLRDLIEPDLFDKETADKLIAGYRRCLEMQAPITSEEEYQLFGEQHTFQTNLAPVISDGDVTQIVGVTRDVTERKEREQQLRAREQELERTTALLQRVQRMAQVGGFELDMRTDPPQATWTDELYRLHDLPRDANIDLDTIIDRYHPDDRNRVRQVIESSLSSGMGYDIEARMITGANDLRWVRAISDAVYEDDEFVAFRGAIQDITERKRAEEALKASEARFRTLVENAPVIFFATDRNGIFTVLEGRQLARLEREPGELVGQSIFEVYADYPAIPENVHRVLAGEERTWRAEIGDLIFDAYGAPLRNENGEVVGAIGVATDVTERTRVARENARLVDDLRTMSIRLLEAQEQERRRIARELHDEAGALLTSLQMCLDTARQHVPAEENDGAPVAREELQEAQDLTNTLSAQIRQMALNLRPSVLDDLGLAAALQGLADQHAKRTGLTVHLYHELRERQRFSEPVETAAYRIIQEALTNASRYADVEEVQVMVNMLQDRLRIHVIDEGRGFDLERVQQERATVGLASMRERAELLQGRLEIATAPGEGTRISATLPIQAPEESPQ